MRSIRFFLVAGILATLTLFNFIAALQGYQSSMDEAEALFDSQLRDLAHLVANLDLGSNPEDLVLENDMIFQRWHNNALLLASGHAPSQPVNEFAPGFGFANFDGYRWRTFALPLTGSGDWVLVAERSDLRFLLAENVVLESVVPILLGIPLVGILIWTIVSVALRPLKRLSTELKFRRARDLSPIHYTNTSAELEQVVDSINGFMRRLGAVLEREKRFSADAAHELRTPVSALKIQLHNLRDEIGPEHESFRQLEMGVERMQHLIEQLLSLARITPEEFTANSQILDLYELVEGEIARVYEQFERRGQQLELQGEHNLVEGDEFALLTLVNNLLTNANKYTPDNGSILVTVSKEQGRVWLIVEDSGAGIPKAERERVFDRFYRADHGSDGMLVPGCGLGLTIVSHIASLHNASVEITDSRFETGTAFRIGFEARG